MRDDFEHKAFMLVVRWALIILVLWFLFGYLQVGAGTLNDFNGTMLH